MPTPAVAQYVNAGDLVTLSAAGSIPSYLPDAIFRESLQQQLTMVGFKVETIEIKSGYGLSARDYTATIRVRTRAATLVSAISGLVYDALEGARSYSPQVTITEAQTNSGSVVRETTQPNLATSQLEKTLNQLIGGVGDAAEGLGKTPDKLFFGINMIVVGLVVIVALVAFGPNVKEVARAAR